MDAPKIIRKKLREMESEINVATWFVDETKTEGGRMSPFGREVLQAAKRAGLKQSQIAKFLKLTPGAVSQHYAK